MAIQFFRATTKDDRQAVNLFLMRHNQRSQGSTKGYVAYYVAAYPDDGRPLVDRMVAAAKLCPLHTPQAARFFAGEDWKHVYCLQRLAAYRAPDNLLSRFVAWVLREAGKDERIWFVSTYADTGTLNDATGRPHDGGIYRATNATYCGLTAPKKVEGFVCDGQRHSMRSGPRTHTIRELENINATARAAGQPEPIKILRSSAMHRYCWAVGAPLRRMFRRRALEARMKSHRFVAAYQPRLLVRLMGLFTGRAFRSTHGSATARIACRPSLQTQPLAAISRKMK
jgi:hypothetical protein